MTKYTFLIVTLLLLPLTVLAANVQFTADSIVEFSPSVTPTLYILSGSEADQFTISGSTLTVDIPDSSTFTLGTTSYKVLRLTPSGGTISLTFNSDYYSSGYASQWTLGSSTSNTQVSILIGASQPNSSYLVKVDGLDYGYFDANSSGEVTLTYTAGFSNKTFTIERKDRLGGGIPLPPVSTTCQGNIPEILGGEVRCTFDSGQIVKVVFSPYSIKGTAVVKIEPQNKPEIIKNSPLPGNSQIIGDLVADFIALSGDKELEKFEKEVPITFTYLDNQVKEAKVNEKSLKIYFWDKTTSFWQVLPSSKVNMTTNSITANAPHFALFSVIGEIIEEKPIPEMNIKQILTKMIEILTELIKLYTQLISLLKS